MAFVLRFKLPAAACQALLTLFDTVLPGCIPATNYLVQKFFGLDGQNIQTHYYCSNGECMNYFGSDVPVTCSACDSVYNGNIDLCKNSFMFVFPLVDQLKPVVNKFVNMNFFSVNSHLGTEDELSKVTDGKMYRKCRQQTNITLQFNCDGAPVFNSSKFSIWPIVCAINELPAAIRNSNLMLHTLWFGRVKPCAVTFLQPFVTEITDLYRNGFTFFNRLTNEEQVLYVNADLCICDAPARAMLQEFSQFNGKYGCGFCCHPGQRVEKGSGTVQVYPMNTLYPLRSHSKTLEYAEQASRIGKPVQGVKGASLLTLLPSFDIVRCFVPEYMHCVLLGVVRQFVNLWLDSSSHREPFYIRSVKLLNRLLKSIRPPDEIHRLPRSLDDRKFWKATEYRNFLLIYSPVILVDVLPKRYYTHWLLLCNGIRLLLQDTVTGAMITTSRNCLHKFIALIPDLYDGVHLSYNVHLLSHLPDAVHNWGPLWAHSAFVYEDVLGFIKKTYHGTQHVPKQVFKYFSAWNKLNSFASSLIGSSDAVLCMYKKLSSSNRFVSSAMCINDFVGLQKSFTTLITDWQSAIVHNLLECNSDVTLKYQAYDRFLIRRKVLSTVSYSRQFRRNNSFVLLSNGCYADINCCFVVNKCCCNDVDCHCCKYVVLFVTCYLSSRVPSRYDKYAGIDLSKFMRKVEHGDCQMIAVMQNDVIAKCITVSNTHDDFYALHLPEHQVEPY